MCKIQTIFNGSSGARSTLHAFSERTQWECFVMNALFEITSCCAGLDYKTYNDWVHKGSFSNKNMLNV